MTTDRTLAAQSVTLGYGDRTVIRELDLQVAPGRITAIVGANGSGKSTLLKAMARLLAPQSGRVLLDGRDIHAMPHEGGRARPGAAGAVAHRPGGDHRL